MKASILFPVSSPDEVVVNKQVPSSYNGDANSITLALCLIKAS